MHFTSYDMLSKLAIGLAVAAVICGFLPDNLAIAIAVSRKLHVAIPMRQAIPTLLLVLAGATSAIGLCLYIYRMSSPLRM